MFDLENTNIENNLIMFIPDDTEVTYYFEPLGHHAQYTFSVHADGQTYSVINKSIANNDREIITVSQDSENPRSLKIEGAADSQYTIICTNKYEDAQGTEITREYIVEKESETQNEAIEISLTDDKNSIILQNLADEEVTFSLEFRSTENLDVVDFIPNSAGQVTLSQDEALSISPTNWLTTDAQAPITQTNVVINESTPGFEIILVISALLVVILLNKKKSKKSN
jgi:hypothetical protein